MLRVNLRVYAGIENGNPTGESGGDDKIEGGYAEEEDDEEETVHKNG